ncbi:acyl-CoA dehydrogenase family protein [Jeotgalibacillus soli]|uniref:Acyl-CoA dehydrogenase n=1 Tax=Jeotgalibacillus soli TaxID=889306 RepID=A0A0C2R6E4_9BACL|nr:acyl-CoA dehydrogenase family protein [Jeotgalibacillus soli]KIL45830.1 acyl-CoA dehydrogenase [Jeotgalibacillus soli]
MNYFVRTCDQQRMIDQLTPLIPVFQKREALLDKRNAYPVQNIEDLKKLQYHTLTLPAEFGGQGKGLYEYILMQELIAKGCGATALSIGWHVGTILEFNENRHWNEDVTKWLVEEIKNGALINAAATERDAGSPTRGALPRTTAALSGDEWVIKGEKTYTSLAPLIDYFFVTATIDGTEEAAMFVIPAKSKGVSIRETWDSVAMRGTASHDLVLEDVVIPREYMLRKLDTKVKPSPAGWLLHIPACYIGIAGAARDYAVSFAASYVPSSLGKPIATLPSIKHQIGEMEIKLLSARQVLFHTALLYEEAKNKEQVKELLQSAKVMVTNAAIEIVDLALRIVGARSMSESNPMHRYYMNVRMGLHNPPMEDMAKMNLADTAIRSLQNQEG